MDTRAASPRPIEGLLAEAGRLLASSLDLDETLRTVARLAVPELADWAAVDVLQPDGSLRQLSSGHEDPAKDALLIELRARYRRRSGDPLGGDGVPAVIADGRPAIFQPRPPDLLPFTSEAESRLYEQLGPVSFLVVPLKADGRPLGALTFLSTDPERVYDDRDIPVALELAERCAQAVRNAQAYDEAESSRALLDALIDTAPIGMAFVDLELRFVLINRHLARINRLPVDAHLGRTMGEVLEDEDSESIRSVRRVLRTGVAVRDRELLADGGRAFIASYAPVTGEHGPLGVVCAVVETTERHRAAAAIAQSEARFRALADAGVIGVIRGRGTRLLGANDAFLRMIGRTRQDVLFGNIHWTELTPERWRELDKAKYAELMEKGALAPWEKEYLHSDGTPVPVLIGASALPDAVDDWICFVVDLTERRKAERERERQFERTARLQAVTEQLSAALTQDDVARVIVEAGMAATGACCGVLGLRLEDRALRIEHRFGMAEGAPDALPLDLAAPMPTAVRTAAPVLLESRDEWLRRFPAFAPRGDFEAFAAVPLLSEDRVPGCMGLGFPDVGGFEEADVELLVAIARQGAMALERAQLYEERTYVAQTLQSGLLPRALPQIPSLDVAVRYRPLGDGSEVGGDFYDLFATTEGEWMLAVGDVCGKGTRAAVLTGVVRSTIRALAVALAPAGPDAVLEGVNGALLLEDAAGALATACCGTLRPAPDGCDVTLAAAGHPPPLVLRAAGEIEEVVISGRMLGVAPKPELTTASIRLAPGDLLLLYTDGVPEARAGGQAFGEERLRERLASAAGRPPASVLEIIDDAVQAFAPGGVRDDTALVAVRVPD